MPSPSFAEAGSRHQKVRAAGLHPDYWYPVEYDDRVRRGQVVEVRFWGRSIALYRGADGRLRALENRCAHRQLPLSLGDVTGCALTCAYHGWSYRDDGRLSEIPHELFGQSMPAVRLATYPVRVRYGLIWLFPGNAALAERRAIPEIPELEGPDRWAYVPIDFTWRAHHSMVMDNLCDLTHAYLHRRFPSFRAGRLLSCESEPDRVVMRYEARVGPFAHLRRPSPGCWTSPTSTRTTTRAFSGRTSRAPSRTGPSCSPWTSESPGSSSSSATTGSGPNSYHSGSGTGWCGPFSG